MPISQTILVGAEAGAPHSALGIEAVVKVTGGQTSGAFSIVEMVLPRGLLVPPHMHERTSEVSYILEGELGAMVGDDELQAGPGSFVVRPKCVVHALWSAGGRSVRLLDMYTPAGFEAFGEEMARRFSITPPTPEQLIEIGRRHDVIFFPELAPRLIQKHNLRMPG
ncbi:MAG TPA: cupin domain-containing protein [Candidatus Dormibacteraeota bacterium]|nr:cupin domain-containing protein [Candidatus Dormibacteraeota bacterium]